MYQIFYTCGNEIQVNGNACRIVDSEGRQKFAGTYEQCVEWLVACGCKEIGGTTAYSMAAAAGRKS